MKDIDYKNIVDTSPYKLYMVAAGGGFTIPGSFLNTEGASKLITGFELPHSTDYTSRILGESPKEGYVSEDTAFRLGKYAFEKCKTMSVSVDNKTPLGVGITASLYYKGQREGRINNAFICFYSDEVLSTLKIEFYETTRSLQESIINRLVSIAISVNFDMSKFHDTYSRWSTPIKLVDFQSYYGVRKKYKLASKLKFGEFVHDIKFFDEDRLLVFPGSFNPIHDCHEYIAKKASEVTGLVPILEISVSNFEKPQIDFEDIYYRGSLLKQKGYNYMFTNAPLFSQKLSKVFPHKSITFVVGIDTFERIVNSYEDADNLVNDMKNDNHRKSNFLVFPREGKTINSFLENDDYLTYQLSSIIHPASYDLTVPDNITVISSTKIRNDIQNTNKWDGIPPRARFKL